MPLLSYNAVLIIGLTFEWKLENKNARRTYHLNFKKRSISI